MIENEGAQAHVQQNPDVAGATKAASVEAEPASEPSLDETQALARLIAGSLAEATDVVVRLLVAARIVQPTAGESDTDMGRYALVGMTLELAEAARHALLAAVNSSVAVGRLATLPVRPLARSPLFRPLRQRLPDPNAWLARWIEVGRQEEHRSRHVARAVLGQAVDEIVDIISASPAIGRLVDRQVAILLPKLAADPQLALLVEEVAGRYIDTLAQQPEGVDLLVQVLAGRYLNYLSEHPEELDTLVQRVAGNYLAYLQQQPEEVQVLIRSQGDTYITYLNQHPQQVQTLIQGQSLSLTSEIVEQVRQRTVTGDSLVEVIARSLLRRPLRSELPGPPPEVKRWAQRGRLADDAELPESGLDANQDLVLLADSEEGDGSTGQ